VTDVTQIDPAPDTNAELAEFVAEAHGMGMEVFFDIITNHAANVIDYEEGSCPASVSKDREPYRRATASRSTTVTSPARTPSRR
jgi:glycosidase